jgi:hypothetical protein
MELHSVVLEFIIHPDRWSWVTLTSSTGMQTQDSIMYDMLSLTNSTLLTGDMILLCVGSCLRCLSRRRSPMWDVVYEYIETTTYRSDVQAFILVLVTQMYLQLVKDKMMLWLHVLVERRERSC